MATRPINLFFKREERIWRLVGKKDANSKGIVRAGSLRLQISVGRESFSSKEEFRASGRIDDCVAETTVGDIHDIEMDSNIHIRCIDDPQPEQRWHALVVMMLNPGEKIVSSPNITDEEAIDLARAAIAKRIVVV